MAILHEYVRYVLMNNTVYCVQYRGDVHTPAVVGESGRWMELSLCNYTKHLIAMRAKLMLR
jgi:hypothetical protein